MEGFMAYRILTVIFISFFFFACGCTLPQDPETWTVMSWNVQNLFDGIDDGTEYSEFDPGTGNWNERLYRRRLERTGEVISKGAGNVPDLVILQELEKPEVLDDLADGPLKQFSYPWRLCVPGYSIIRCGVLSRYPLSEVDLVDCGYFGIRPLRPALAFSVDTPGGSVRVVALHWKSPRDGRAATEETRRREAAAVKALVEPLLIKDPGAEVIIIGDLNTPGDGLVKPSALAPWEPGLSGEDTILYRTNVIEGVGRQENGYVYFDPDPDPSAGPAGSYWFRDNWERPDRTLLSLGTTVSPGLVFQNCRIAASQTMGDSDGRPEPWVSAWEEGYSDHLPLFLTFALTGDNEPPNEKATSRRPFNRKSGIN